jgi:hypothetical protein
MKKNVDLIKKICYNVGVKKIKRNLKCLVKQMF